MVKRGLVELMDSEDAQMYQWVDLELVETIFFFYSVEKVEETHV